MFRIRHSFEWIKKLLRNLRAKCTRKRAEVINPSLIEDPELKSPAQFRADIRAKYREAFSDFAEVLTVVEQAVAEPRSLDSDLRLAIDMMLTQSYKSLASVYQLAVRAQIEDAATIARRLWEIGVQSVFIGAADTDDERTNRAGRFLAHLWDKYDPEVKDEVPVVERAQWERILGTYKHLLPEKRKRWGPNYWEMLDATGLTASYDDYEFLSSIAHGSPPSLVKTYSSPRINLRDDRHVPVVLVYSSRYALSTLEQWNRVFHLVSESDFDRLVAKASRDLKRPDAEDFI